MLAALLVMLCPTLAGARADRSATGLSTEQPPSVPTLVGADVSALERIEEAGATFRGADGDTDAIAILRAEGSTLLRLRVFVDPTTRRCGSTTFRTR